jgi:hypothetical protein
MIPIMEARREALAIRIESTVLVLVKFSKFNCLRKKSIEKERNGDTISEAKNCSSSRKRFMLLEILFKISKQFNFFIT